MDKQIFNISSSLFGKSLYNGTFCSLNYNTFMNLLFFLIFIKRKCFRLFWYFYHSRFSIFIFRAVSVFTTHIKHFTRINMDMPNNRLMRIYQYIFRIKLYNKLTNTEDQGKSYKRRYIYIYVCVRFCSYGLYGVIGANLYNTPY